jgi:hypothetical protein
MRHLGAIFHKWFSESSGVCKPLSKKGKWGNGPASAFVVVFFFFVCVGLLFNAAAMLFF